MQEYLIRQLQRFSASSAARRTVAGAVSVAQSRPVMAPFAAATTLSLSLRCSRSTVGYLSSRSACRGSCRDGQHFKLAQDIGPRQVSDLTTSEPAPSSVFQAHTYRERNKTNNNHILHSVQQSHPRHEEPTRQAAPIPKTHHRHHSPRNVHSASMPRARRQAPGAAGAPAQEIPRVAARQDGQPAGDPGAVDGQCGIRPRAERCRVWAAAGHGGAATDPRRDGRAGARGQVDGGESRGRGLSEGGQRDVGGGDDECG